MYSDLDKAKMDAMTISIEKNNVKVFVSGNSYGNFYMVSEDVGYEDDDIGNYIVCFFINGEEEYLA